jgi:hypothetical protein
MTFFTFGSDGSTDRINPRAHGMNEIERAAHGYASDFWKKHKHLFRP